MTRSSLKSIMAMLILPAVLFASGIFCAAAEGGVPLAGSRMLYVSANSLYENEPSVIAARAAEKGYTHIIAGYYDALDRKLYTGLCAAALENNVGVLVLVPQGANAGRLRSTFKKCVLSGVILEFSDPLSDTEAALRGLADAGLDAPLGVFADMTAATFGAEGAKLLASWKDSGLCDFLLAEDHFSSYSEHGFAQELADWRELAGGLPLIAAADLGRLLDPTFGGDFYGDVCELNYQYVLSLGAAEGFAVWDYRALVRNAYGAADSLSAEFACGGYAALASSLKIDGSFAVARPYGGTANVSTDKYTIFVTSDPTLPLLMDGEEVERSGSAGLFAVQVAVAVGTNTFEFSQGSAAQTVTLVRAEAGAVSTISGITSASPVYQRGVRVGETVKLSCVAPSGGAVSAYVDGQYVQLYQNAATAYNGVPAVFSAEFVFTGSGSYPEDETVDAGKVTYTLSYGGVSTFTSAGSIVVLAPECDFVVECAVPFCGVEKNAADEGNYVTTLKKDCRDKVAEDAGDWLLLSCGGYVNKANVSIVLGETPSAENTVSAFTFGSDGRGEYLSLACSELPSYTLEWNARAMSITFFSTSFGAAPDSSYGEIFSRVDTAENEDGSASLSLSFSEDTWGYNIETDGESSALKIYVRRRPVLSGSLSSPLSGIVVVLDAGHGGIDPGALSVAGADGVTEAEINNVNALVLKDVLERLGAQVTYNFAAAGEKLEFPGRMEPAEEQKADIYISLHCNSVAESADANLYCGTEVYYHYEHSAEFAALLAENVSRLTGRDNEGARQSYYRVTRMSFAPSVLIECGYVSNPAELESLIDPLAIERTANAVARSILAVLEA